MPFVKSSGKNTRKAESHATPAKANAWRSGRANSADANKKTVKNKPAGLGSGKITSPSPSPLKGEGKILSEYPVFNQAGKEVEKMELPENIFGLKINQGLIKQAVEAQMSQSRIHYAHTKTRGEVRGGGRKPWRQKGTGRARHGSTRSPIWVGGGVTFGPRNDKNFAKKINKKIKRQALLAVLSGKARDKEIILLDDLKLAQPKTKLMAEVIGNLKLSDKSILLTMPAKDENIIRAARNIPKVLTMGAGNLNVVDLLSRKYLLMTKEAVGVIEKIFGK